MRLYAIHDRVAQLHHNPFVQRNDDEALRSFVALCADDKSFVSKNPSDFELIRLGDYDEYDGVIISDKALIS